MTIFLPREHEENGHFSARSCAKSFSRTKFNNSLCKRFIQGLSLCEIITRIEALVFDANPGKIYQSMENVNLGVFLHADSEDSKVMRDVNLHRGAFL